MPSTRPGRIQPPTAKVFAVSVTTGVPGVRKPCPDPSSEAVAVSGVPEGAGAPKVTPAPARAAAPVSEAAEREPAASASFHRATGAGASATRKV
ncbi:hypothetical protein ACFWUT_22685 [Streptomyces cyaneofuscatus]|uniref:hypothetical protein n=1 Tax=Streptomyces cyaneofuscatus TaxID=66883 RepID=UPI00365C7455